MRSSHKRIGHNALAFKPSVWLPAETNLGFSCFNASPKIAPITHIEGFQGAAIADYKKFDQNCL